MVVVILCLPLVRKEINLSTPMVTVDGSTIVNKAIDVIRMLVLDCLGVVLAFLKHAVHGGHNPHGGHGQR